MNQEMKYVVVSSEAGEQLFTFPKSIDHAAFAEVLSYIKQGTRQNWKRAHRQPVSAGFTDGVRCYGRSETLGLDSRPGDTTLLRGGSEDRAAPPVLTERQAFMRQNSGKTATKAGDLTLYQRKI